MTTQPDSADVAAKALAQVDDVLLNDWIAVTDGDYRTALLELIRLNIQQHDDPAISEVASKRQSELTALKAQAQGAYALVKALESIYTRASCAPHDDPELASSEFSRIMEMADDAVVSYRVTQTESETK